jgi:hypothetical protein
METVPPKDNSTVTSPVNETEMPFRPWSEIQVDYTLSMTLPAFQRDNWMDWSEETLSTLRTAGLHKMVLGKQPLPPIDDRVSRVNYRDMSRIVVLKLMECLPKYMYWEFADVKSPSEIWSKLREQAARDFPDLYLDTLKELDDIQLRDVSEFAAHVAKLNRLSRRAKRLRSEITEDQVLRARFIRSLPYDVYCALLRGHSTGLTYEELVAFARERSRANYGHRDTERRPNQVFNKEFKPRLPRTPGETCEYCWRKNHTKSQCYTRTNDIESGIHIAHRPKHNKKNKYSKQNA